MTTPTTPTPMESKYQLKTLHADIDLFDRRLAHLLKYEVFATETARAAAARKITLKRDPLVITQSASRPKALSSRRASFRAPSAPKALPLQLKSKFPSPNLPPCSSAPQPT
jgi:hypothetical protein